MTSRSIEASTELLRLSFKDRKEFNEVLQRAVEQSPSAVAITDEDGVLEYVNAQFCAITGYAAEEVVGRPSALLKSETMPGAFYKDLWATLEDGQEWRGEFHNRKKNGELYWEAALISPVRDEQGVIRHFIKMAEDITVQKRLQADLEERDEKLRLITNHMADMVSFLDPAGYYQYTTPSCAVLLGYAPGELIGTNAFDLMCPDHRTASREAMERVFREGRGAAEFQYRHKDGRYVWMEAVGTPIPGPDGSPIGAVIAARVIEERKRIQQELEASYQAIQSREQALKASYDQLAAASEALKRSEEHLRRMATLDSLTGLLNRRGFEEELRKVASLAERRKAPVGVLIVDLDHFKTINDLHGHPAGDQVLRDCAALLREKLRTSDVLCRYGGDELVAALPLAGAEETQAAGERMLQSVRNHGFQAGSGTVRVTISIGAACSRDGPDLLLSRADQALYRAKQAGRNQFVFWTPPGLAAGEPLAVTPAPARGAARGRLLVVDDEVEIRRVIASILSGAGYDVVSCADGHEAREYVEREGAGLDVALVDLSLGEENGLDLLKTLRRKQEHLVGIVVTGAATMETAVETLRVGAFDFVTKPFDSKALLAALDRAMIRRRLLLENLAQREGLEHAIRDKSAALSRTADQLRDSYRFTLEALAAMLDAREKTTGAHSKCVAEMSRILAAAMHQPPDMIERIAQGALLHDIGKVAIPDNLLCKKGPLTEEEWRIVRTHVDIGYRILRTNPDFEKVAEIVWSHHERYDGKGYPRGLKGEDICIGARIFSVVDAYDAIRADRPYAASRPPGEALLEIQCHSGQQFDPVVVDALARCHAEVESRGWWPENPPG